MLERLKTLLLGDDPASADGNADDARLAAAALLVEAAMADGNMDEDERALIIRLLQERFSLAPEGAAMLLERAREAQENSSQLFPFAKVIVEQFDPAQRTELIEMLWEVAYADNRLHDYEASLVRRVAGLLYVSDQDSGRARLRAIAITGATDAFLI